MMQRTFNPLRHSVTHNFKDVGAKHLVSIIVFYFYKDVAAMPLRTANAEPGIPKNQKFSLSLFFEPRKRGLKDPRKIKKNRIFFIFRDPEL